MKQLNKQEVLAYVRKKCSHMKGLYEYLDMALNDLTVVETCEKYDITRTDLQWGLYHLRHLGPILMDDNLGIEDTSKLIDCGDAALPFYIKDTRRYDSGTPITADEIREAWDDFGMPISVDLAIRIVTTAITPIDLCKEFNYDYKTAWYIYQNVHNWAKYSLSGTYVNITRKVNPSFFDEVQLLNWAIKKGFPLDVVSILKDVLNASGYVHPHQLPALEEVREVMYKECISYRSSNNKGKIHWGDKWKPFYVEIQKGEYK